jgi:hypothetical protein
VKVGGLLDGERPTPLGYRNWIIDVIETDGTIE